MKLLLIDESPEDLVYYRRHLSRLEAEGWQVLEADSAETAMRMMSQEAFDCVVLDYAMPGVDGLGFLQSIRLADETPPCGVIFLTGAGSETIAVEAMKGGAHDYLVKEEVTPSLLQHAAKAAVEQSRLQQRLADTRRELEHRALYDSLTGLANRTLFLDRLAHATQRATRENMRIGVMLVDLDRFKQVNDTHGHAVGDAVLSGLAERMVTTLRAIDTIGRLGGDEFVVLLEPGIGVADAERIAERLHAQLCAPVRTRVGPVSVGASIGVAFSSAGTADPDRVLRRADAAMYTAKRAGGGIRFDGGDLI